MLCPGVGGLQEPRGGERERRMLTSVSLYFLSNVGGVIINVSGLLALWEVAAARGGNWVLCRSIVSG